MYVVYAGICSSDLLLVLHCGCIRHGPDIATCLGASTRYGCRHSSIPCEALGILGPKRDSRFLAHNTLVATSSLQGKVLALMKAFAGIGRVSEFLQSKFSVQGFKTPLPTHLLYEAASRSLILWPGLCPSRFLAYVNNSSTARWTPAPKILGIAMGVKVSFLWHCCG